MENQLSNRRPLCFNPFISMTANQKKFPTQFYSRTLIPWAGVLFLGPIVGLWTAIGLSVLFDFEFLDEPTNSEEAIALLGVAALFAPMVIASLFQVFVRQSPTLKIHREGIMIREVWTPIRFASLLFIPILSSMLWPFAIFYAAFVVFFRLFTLQLFRVRIFHLQWEEIETIFPEKNGLTIVGWCDKGYNDFEQEIPKDFHSFSYDAGSFGMSINKVSESIQFFWYDSDAREILSSWHREEIPLGNETFGFDL